MNQLCYCISMMDAVAGFLSHIWIESLCFWGDYVTPQTPAGFAVKKQQAWSSGWCGEGSRDLCSVDS